MESMAAKKVYVVGGAGFLGSHLVDHLVNIGCFVSILDDLSVGRREFINPQAELHEFSILDTSVSLRRLFTGTDHVFNYSSMPYIPDCYERPIDVVSVNTIGALRVIEGAHEAGVKRILQVSSAEVYGNQTWSNMTDSEVSLLDPPSTYAASKAAIDMLARCRYVEANVPVIILRQFNCVGERETHPYVIPEIISQVYSASEGEHGKISINLGNDTERDFMYAGDAVRIATKLIQQGEPGQTYNLGSEDNISIYTLAHKIAKIMRPKCSLEIAQEESRLRAVEIWSLKSNNDKIYKCVGVRPTISLDEALEKTITYFKSNNHSWGF